MQFDKITLLNKCIDNNFNTFWLLIGKAHQNFTLLYNSIKYNDINEFKSIDVQDVSTETQSILIFNLNCNIKNKIKYDNKHISITKKPDGFIIKTISSLVKEGYNYEE